MRSVPHLFVLAALVATTSSALAQERGPRGFGGGPGGAASGAMLLGQKSVQEDLKLSEEQVKQVDEFTAKQRESFSGLREASREERMKKFAESREAGEKAVGAILNEEQQTRLKQIGLQLAGPAAFASPEVAEKLAFTDEQKKSIEEIQSAQREEMRSLFQDADGDRAAAFRKAQAARQATEEKLKGVLTDEQKTKWDELIGKKFEGQLQGPGGRGFGRGRRGGDDASLRREADTTVLTADKSDEGKAEEAKAEKKEVAKKTDGERKKTKHRGDSQRKHAGHGKHRPRGEHASGHRSRGPHSPHAHHRHGHHRGPMPAFAHRGHHRHPHAGFAHHGRRPSFGGPMHGRHFAHHGPHRFEAPHHFGRHHFAHHKGGHGFDARRAAWNRMALAMGAHHGPRSFSHAGPRHHGSRPPHHFAHRGPGQHRHAFGAPHYAARSWRGAGQMFHVWPHHDRGHEMNRHHFAAHHRGHGHGERHGHDERHVSGFAGPHPPHFAWHVDRHREDGQGVDRQHGPGEHPRRMYSAGFKRRPHDAREHDRDRDHSKQDDGERHGPKRHGKGERDHKAGDKQEDRKPDAQKN